MYLAWRRYRLTMLGGDFFMGEYLKQHKRESQDDWDRRKQISYVVPTAKAAVIEVANSIFKRLPDVVRYGGPPSYQAAVRGLGIGVDQCSATMDSFIGRLVVPELLPMQRVGVWVDRVPIEGERTLADYVEAPYLYIYPTETIKSWTFRKGGRQGEFSSVLLEHYQQSLDPNTQLPNGPDKKLYRFVFLNDHGTVTVREQEADGNSTERDIDLPRIPFVLFQIQHSLLEDASHMQIALLNLASCDVDFATRANVILYTEQFDPKVGASYVRPPQAAPNVAKDMNGNPIRDNEGRLTHIPVGQAIQAQEARRPEVVIGNGRMRQYPLGANQPAFVNPSDVPLRVSMDKQEQIKKDIRASVHLRMSTLTAARASAESKDADEAGLNTGLLAIASVLEQGEREIAAIWAMYEGEASAIIRYPEDWSEQSDEERRKDASELKAQIGSVPSRTFAKEVTKQIAHKLIGHKVSLDVMDKIAEEVDTAKALTYDHGQLILDVENGLVSAETASSFLGYAPEEVGKAAVEHAERVARVLAAQGGNTGAPDVKSADNVGDPGARGVPDLSVDPNAAATEKKTSKSTVLDDKVTKKTRGDGK